MSQRSVPHLQRGKHIVTVAVCLFVFFNLFSSLWNMFTFIELLSFNVIVFQKYKSYSPYDMQESIIKEVKGDLQKSFLVLGKYA